MTDLNDGETTEMKGSGKKPYVLKNIAGLYSCSCPAWRNQSNSIDFRTCKHIIKLRGEPAEKLRLGGAFPANGKKPAKSAKTVAKQAEAAKNKPPILLAHKWKETIDPTDWWMSEKLDGVRAFWDGKNFISRMGNIYHAPKWFKKGLPKRKLDGELWIGRGEFQLTVSTVRRQEPDDELWKAVQYLVFDSPNMRQPFEKRMSKLRGLTLPKHVKILPQTQCINKQDLLDMLKRVEAQDGEGVMLREPGSLYEEGRSHTLLKVKTFHDAEAKVLSHSGGHGRHKGRLGALNCETMNGIKFRVGSGFSDKERDSPPPINSIITFRYQELTKDGVPRFPTFLRQYLV